MASHKGKSATATTSGVLSLKRDLNAELDALAEKIEQYRSGKGVPEMPPSQYSALDRMSKRLQHLSPFGGDHDPECQECKEIEMGNLDYRAAYEDAFDRALNIKQKYAGHIKLAPLPAYQSNPKMGLTYLAEWCCDSIQEEVEESNKLPANTPPADSVGKNGAERNEADEQDTKKKIKQDDTGLEWHTPDFRNVRWYGKPYQFNNKQAKAIKLLWCAHKDPSKVGVHESEIGKAVDTGSDKYRLLDTFRQRRGGIRGFHAAWQEMIKHIGNGIYQLTSPEQDNAESS